MNLDELKEEPHQSGEPYKVAFYFAQESLKKAPLHDILRHIANTLESEREAFDISHGFVVTGAMSVQREAKEQHD